MPDSVGTGDTYGPLNYLLYVPFLWLFGWSVEWDYLPAAHAVTAFAFVGGALAMLVAGLRYAGARGWRCGGGWGRPSGGGGGGPRWRRGSRPSYSPSSSRPCGCSTTAPKRE